jgi:hypothetical protein
MYTVSCLEPAARIVPSLLCFVEIWVALEEADELELVEALDPDDEP